GPRCTTDDPRKCRPCSCRSSRDGIFVAAVELERPAIVACDSAEGKSLSARIRLRGSLAYGICESMLVSRHILSAALVTIALSLACGFAAFPAESPAPLKSG